MVTRFSVAVAAALFAVHDALALAPWVTDEVLCGIVLLAATAV